MYSFTHAKYWQVILNQEFWRQSSLPLHWWALISVCWMDGTLLRQSPLAFVNGRISYFCCIDPFPKTPWSWWNTRSAYEEVARYVGTHVISTPTPWGILRKIRPDWESIELSLAGWPSIFFAQRTPATTRSYLSVSIRMVQELLI